MFFLKGQQLLQFPFLKFFFRSTPDWSNLELIECWVGRIKTYRILLPQKTIIVFVREGILYYVYIIRRLGSLGILRSSSISLNSINFLRPVSNSISFKFDEFPADAIFKVRAAPSLSSERRSEESIFTHSYAFLLLLRDWRRNLRKLGKSARLQDFFFIDAFKHEIRCPCYCE